MLMFLYASSLYLLVIKHPIPLIPTTTLTPDTHSNQNPVDKQ